MTPEVVCKRCGRTWTLEQWREELPLDGYMGENDLDDPKIELRTCSAPCGNTISVLADQK